MQTSVPILVKANGYHTIDAEKHFIVTTTHGFRLHQINGCTLVKNCIEIPGGLSLCQSYRNSNIFFVVGTGANLEWPRNKLFIWNDEEKRIVSELEFFAPIVDLKVVQGWILVAQEDKVMIFNFEGIGMTQAATQEFSTKINKRGLIDLHADDDGATFVVPYDKKKGHALVVFVPYHGRPQERIRDVCKDYHNY
jgi:hypothetical protein